MKNKIKIGLVGIVTSLLLNGCMENNPENIVEDYISGLKSGDFKKVSKTMSSDLIEQFSSNIILSCGTQDRFKNEVIPELNKENIDKKVLDIIYYKNFSSDIKNKVIGLCFKSMMSKVMKEQKDTTMKILSSEINSNGNTSRVKFEETRKDGQGNQHTLKLEKINNEWKITEGLF